MNIYKSLIGIVLAALFFAVSFTGDYLFADHKDMEVLFGKKSVEKESDTVKTQTVEKNNSKNEEGEGETVQGNTIEKTYRLEYVTPHKVERKLREYIIESTTFRSPHKIRVKLLKKDVAVFEEKLAQLDREPRTVAQGLRNLGRELTDVSRKIFHKKKKRNHTVYFKIFTVIASRENVQSDIHDAELKDVLEELRRVFNFKSFKMDGVSAITIADTAPYNILKLSSNYSDLILRLDHISLKGRVKGYREIIIDNLVLRENREPLISTRTSLLEGGYLVVGVTRIGEEPDSLVLIIHATINDGINDGTDNNSSDPDDSTAGTADTD